jgi:phosphoenolpyruvate carboxylase
MQGSHPTKLLSPLIKSPRQITKVEKKIAMKILRKTINAPVPVKKVVVRIAPAQTGKISKIKSRSTIYNNTSRKQTLPHKKF